MWDQADLAAATLARQFGSSHATVAGTVEAMGPVQTQVARSAYVGIAARRPGTTYEEVEAAYRESSIVRGSSVRGTVHTVTIAEHGILDMVSRAGTQTRWRALGIEPTLARAALEEFAAEAWRTPEDLRSCLSRCVQESGAAPPEQTVRSLAHVHSALVRRPEGGAGWDRQSAPVYRLVDRVAGVPFRPEPAEAMRQVCLIHLRAFGPAQDVDVAWWSGSRITAVRSALAELVESGAVRRLQGPLGDGSVLFDTPSDFASGPAPITVLLPEFDSLVVGYAPANRTRFVDADHRDHYWKSANGTCASLLLHDGRARGVWRLTGSGRRRSLEVRMFPGERKIGSTNLKDPQAALGRVLDVQIAEPSVSSG